MSFPQLCRTLVAKRRPTQNCAIFREAKMKIIDPGHLYSLEALAQETGSGRRPVASSLRFVKRIGARYPGNEEPGYDGTTSQEVIRALIDRAKYVDNQISDPMNFTVLVNLRTALLCLEIRAAQQRGEFEAFLKQLATVRAVIPSMNRLHEIAEYLCIEELPTCRECGHIACGKHVVET